MVDDVIDDGDNDYIVQYCDKSLSDSGSKYTSKGAYCDYRETSAYWRIE